MRRVQDTIHAMSDATRLLEALGRGEGGAADELLPLIYEELRRLARGQMARERAGHTLQATALVNEAYLRLVQGKPATWDGRRHFFGAAAEAMRRILIEHARRRNSLKAGGAERRVELNSEPPAISSPCDQLDLLALNDALDRLAAEDAESAELVKLLYFAGLSLQEAGSAMGLSKTAAHRRWVFARAWLHDAMRGGGRDGTETESSRMG